MSKNLLISEQKEILAGIEADLYKPLQSSDNLYKIWLIFLIIIIGAGLVCWGIQINEGLGVTGMRDYISWGLYVGNFVFFVAVSLVGSLISSIMHLLKIKNVTPMTRIAEIIAIATVAMAGVFIVIDMGRPERLLNVFAHGRFASPILWDVTVIITYLTISVLLFILPLIPDMARLRDKLHNIPLWQRKLYNILSFSWIGSDEQYATLKKATHILLILIIPIALSIHTVTSWLFSSTLRPGWDSTIFGPYFVSGAFVVGVAAVILAMYVYRWRFGLQKYYTKKHFDLLSKLLVLVTLVYLYFNINEFLVPMYKTKKVEELHLHALFTGDFAFTFWFSQVLGMLLPVILLLFPAMRKPLPATIISLFVLIGGWLKRYIIVVPTMYHPFFPIQNVPDNFHVYFPTTIEMVIAAFPFAVSLLIITLLAKYFPVLPIWEYAQEKGVSKEVLSDNV